MSAPVSKKDKKDKKKRKKHHDDDDSDSDSYKKTKHRKKKQIADKAVLPSFALDQKEDKFPKTIDEQTKDMLFQQLTCPVCMQFMDNKIFMCEKSHTVCDSCRKDILIQAVNNNHQVKCPICREVSSLEIRNLPLESLAAIQPIVCRIEGCKQSFPASQREKHEKECEFQFYELGSDEMYYNEKSCLQKLNFEISEKAKNIGQQVSEWSVCFENPGTIIHSWEYLNRFARYKNTWLLLRLALFKKQSLKAMVYHFGVRTDIWFKIELLHTPFSFTGKAYSLRGPNVTGAEKNNYGMRLYSIGLPRICNCKRATCIPFTCRMYLFNSEQELLLFTNLRQVDQKHLLSGMTRTAWDFATGLLNLDPFYSADKASSCSESSSSDFSLMTAKDELKAAPSSSTGLP